MRSVKIFRLLPLAAVILLASCSKDLMNSEITELSDGLLLQKSADESEKSADVMTLRCRQCGTEEMRAQLDACAQITDSGADSYPRTIVIDYGTEGCGTDERHLKKGKILISISADMSSAGAVRTVTYENFFVGEREMKGSRTLTNIGSSDSGQPIFEYEDNIEMTHEGRTHARTAEGTRTWISGFDTPADCSDDIFSMTGSSTMSGRRGEPIVRQILEPLLIDASCTYHHPLSGIVQMNGPRGTHTLDFGDGTCDNEALLSKENGETETVDLDEMQQRRRRRGH